MIFLKFLLPSLEQAFAVYLDVFRDIVSTLFSLWMQPLQNIPGHLLPTINPRRVIPKKSKPPLDTKCSLNHFQVKYKNPSQK